jgi:integrase
MANIRRRKLKTQISFQVRIRRAGIRDIVKSFLTRTEAKRWARSMETKLDRGDFSDYTEASKLTLGDIAKRYIDGGYHLKKKGARYEEYRYSQLLENTISGVNLLKLSSKHLAEYRAFRLQEVEPATWNKDFNFISVIINTAIFEWGIYLPNNPCKMIKRSKEPAPRLRVLEDEEYSRLLKACREVDLINLEHAFVFSIETTMRQGELLRAKWEYVNFKKRTLFIPDTKTGFLSKDLTSNRTIPLSGLAIQTLQQLPRHISGRIFPITRDQLNQKWKLAKKKAKIKNYRWHDNRCTGITWCFEKKHLEISEVMTLSGHKSPTILLKRYTKLNPTKIAMKI